MDDYIKREDIIKWIDDSLEMCGDRYSVDQENMMELFRTVVNDCLPFADVVEVVRCKDCDMAKSGSDEREMYCTFDHCYKGKNYFCADGRRKNEDSN